MNDLAKIIYFVVVWTSTLILLFHFPRRFVEGASYGSTLTFNTVKNEDGVLRGVGGDLQKRHFCNKNHSAIGRLERDVQRHTSKCFNQRTVFCTVLHVLFSGRLLLLFLFSTLCFLPLVFYTLFLTLSFCVYSPFNATRCSAQCCQFCTTFQQWLEALLVNVSK